MNEVYLNSVKTTFLTKKYYKAGFRSGFFFGFILSSLVITGLLIWASYLSKQ